MCDKSDVLNFYNGCSVVVFLVTPVDRAWWIGFEGEFITPVVSMAYNSQNIFNLIRYFFSTIDPNM